MTLFDIFTPENSIAFLAITTAAIYFHWKWDRQTIALAPALLTTIGIFFCFFGIALGLLTFDANDIKGSVPQLLNGIRTAFWASVLGIGAALTVKVRRAIYGLPAVTDEKTDGANLGDLAEQLAKLNRSISGDDDSTLISQIKLARSDSNEKLNRLQQSFDNFVKLMAEANSKALIEALSNIISDFNTQLKEQFGENFKNLNAAVEKLVVWQQEYKVQLSDLITQETATRESMKVSAEQFSTLVKSSESFSRTAADLANLLVKLETQKDQLLSLLKMLSDLVRDASDKVPRLEPALLKLVDQILTGVTESQTRITSALEQAAKTTKENDQMFRQLLTDSLAAANKDLNSHIKQLSEETKKNVVLLDAALEKELTKSIETLGKQLTALSQKFVQDYTPLTEQLRRLTNDLSRR